MMTSATSRAGLLLAAGAVLLPCGACLPAAQEFLAAVVFSVYTDAERFGVDPGPPRYEAKPFFNFETPHVHPLDLSPDGSRLFAVNTPDHRLEVLSLDGDALTLEARVPVGLEPVTARARSRNEVWVVNHLSDSVSIVDVPGGNVVRTLHPGDEPTDVVFAAGRAFVVCSQANRVVVYDLDDLDAPPAALDVQGEDPRAAAVAPDGRTVYVAIFESGNRTTLVPEPDVSDPSGPYGGLNPPPSPFVPEEVLSEARANGAAPSGLIVRRDEHAPVWRDDNGVDWSRFITWDVLDHDVMVIDAESLEVRYVRSLMNLNMALAVRADGVLTVVGTDALNHVRYEPVLRGRFVQSVLALCDVGVADDAKSILHLNPHLDDALASDVRTLPIDERGAALADPRAVVWTRAADAGYVAGMGSNNVARIGPNGERHATIDVPPGPTGLRLDEPRGRLYVYSRFAAAIVTVDLERFEVVGRLDLPDPTPPEVRAGRVFLYNARRTSGLGVTACAACHVDGRIDHLAWDLGDPYAAVKPFDQECDTIVQPLGWIGDQADVPCEDFHPLKGPMITQSLQGIIGVEPLHWRGDRGSLEEFNGAFQNLNGADQPLTAEEMAAFKAFVASLEFPPNPHRTLDDGLPEVLAGGNPRRGREVYMRAEIDAPDPDLLDLDFLGVAIVNGKGPVVSCNRCHQLPTGTNGAVTPANLLAAPLSVKVPQLRNVFERTGFFDKESAGNHRGFGVTHDGRFATVEDFMRFDRFVFGHGQEGEQRRRDAVAFVFAFPTGTHPAVGQQVTAGGGAATREADRARLALFMKLADQGVVGLIARGAENARPRGFVYRGGGAFESAGGEVVGAAALFDAAAPGRETTFTVVPLGTQRAGD